MSNPHSYTYLWKLGVWVAVVDRFPVPLQVVLGVGLVVRLKARLIAPRMPYDGRIRLESWPLCRYVQRTYAMDGGRKRRKSVSHITIQFKINLSRIQSPGSGESWSESHPSDNDG